jgi:hypothetical protein
VGVVTLQICAKKLRGGGDDGVGANNDESMDTNDEFMNTDTETKMNSTPSTPERKGQLAESECPPAPLRLRRALSSATDSDTSPETCCNAVPRVLIPTVADHKGLGILAGDFIKPDPGLTLRERETYILDELHRWLDGRIQVHAREAGVACTREELEGAVMTGMWPAARLCLLVEELGGDRADGSRQVPEELYHAAAVFAEGVCQAYLVEGVEPDCAAEELAVGFVTVDRLPDGRTILDCWNAPSVFEPLRNATPLREEGLEDRIERALSFWEIPLKLEMPLWVWVALTLWVLLYAWLVAVVVSVRS